MSVKVSCPFCGSEELKSHDSSTGRYICCSCKKTTRKPVVTEDIKPASIVKDTLVITWAQNGTPVNKKGLESLLTYCKKKRAQLLVIPGRYKNPTSLWTDQQEEAERWAPEIEPYLVAERVSLNKHLELCADVKIQPTATNPLSGLLTLSGGESCIIGHPQIVTESVATMQGKHAKLCMTTGAITKPNYTDSKAGVKGEFHHQYGARVVELCADGIFHVRDLCIDGHGKFYDLDECFDGKKHTKNNRALGFVSGDFHAKFLDQKVKESWWTGKKSLLKRIRPKSQVFHDLFDGYFGSHHHERDPFLKVRKHFSGDNNGMMEVEKTISELNDCLICERNYVAKSNHDEHLDRWLKESDWKKDPVNAEMYLDTALKFVQASKKGDSFDPLEYLLAKKCKKAKFLKRSDNLYIKGINLSNHGDRGPNGSRGSLKSFGKVGCKNIIGHSHSCGRDKGTLQVGLSAIFGLEYAIGSPSSWTHTGAIIYPNGHMTLIHCINGEYSR